MTDQDGVPEMDDDRNTPIDDYEKVGEWIGLNAHLIRVPNFGLWNPSIKEAAELVVVDMWFAGFFKEVIEPDDFDGDAHAMADSGSSGYYFGIRGEVVGGGRLRQIGSVVRAAQP